jgi:NAD(P)-dependent dehydrogenase (short-subunit alcohol dehydrogenase family)
VSEPDRKVLLLTGGSGQIGTAFCERYADTYDIVAVRHRHTLTVPTQYQQIVDPFADGVTGAQRRPGSTESGDDSVFEVTADLRDASEVARVVEVALARYGQIDVVVNTVGAFDRGAHLLGNALSGATALFTLNALVPISVAVQVALDFWRHHDRENVERNRVVVNVSATAGVDAADPTTGRTFGATKAALNMLSLHLAAELEPFHVRVTTVAPAPVPDVVTLERVTSAIASMIEGHQTGQILLLWDDGEELV